MSDETTAPDVSVVIPCYNAERWVGRAIDSVLAQEGVTVEVIVIDDGSTDGSVDVLRAYTGRIYWETGPNRGACAARNRGLAMSRADYVMFLDADDYLCRSAVQAVMRESRAGQDSDVLLCGHEVIYEGQRIGKSKHLDPSRIKTCNDLVAWLLTKGFIPPIGTIWRRRFLMNLGGWGSSQRHQDAELLYRAIASEMSFQVIEVQLGVYFQHSSNRISGDSSHRTIRSCLQVFQSTDKRMLQLADVPAWQQYRSLWAYSLMRLAASAGDLNSYSRAKADWVRFGRKSRERRRLHRSLERLLGVYFMQRLKTSARILRQLKNYA